MRDTAPSSQFGALTVIVPCAVALAHRAYGAYSDAVKDYVEQGLMD